MSRPRSAKTYRIELISAGKTYSHDVLASNWYVVLRWVGKRYRRTEVVWCLDIIGLDGKPERPNWNIGPGHLPRPGVQAKPQYPSDLKKNKPRDDEEGEEEEEEEEEAPKAEGWSGLD